MIDKQVCIRALLVIRIGIYPTIIEMKYLVNSVFFSYELKRIIIHLVGLEDSFFTSCLHCIYDDIHLIDLRCLAFIIIN